MKANLFSGLVAILLFNSCVATSYYQVFKTQSTNEMQNNDNTLIYSDENCTIFYNFWSNGGSIQFAIQNNSEENIYLNKKECFFICNGYAYDYFRNRTYTIAKGLYTETLTAKTVSDAGGVSIDGVNVYGYDQTNSIAAAKSYAISTNVGNNNSNSISWEEPQIVCIPPKSRKVISGFEKITNTLIRNCDLYRFPTIKQTNSTHYSETESPLIFSNKLAYYLEGSTDLIRINNEFYISEIKN